MQVYVSAPVSEMDMPEQELKGFQKTMLLAPGEKEDIKIRIPLRNLASYSENAGGYILSKGELWSAYRYFFQRYKTGVQDSAGTNCFDRTGIGGASVNGNFGGKEGVN